MAVDTQRLNKIFRRLGIALDDTQEKDLINDLIEDAESYFKTLTGQSEVDAKYNFMIENAVYKMYGRKGSEAVKSESVDGYSVTFDDWDSYFKPYMAILDKDFGLNGSYREKGKVVFL